MIFDMCAAFVAAAVLIPVAFIAGWGVGTCLFKVLLYFFPNL